MLLGVVINDWLEVKPKAFNPESGELSETGASLLVPTLMLVG